MDIAVAQRRRTRVSFGDEKRGSFSRLTPIPYGQWSAFYAQLPEMGDIRRLLEQCESLAEKGPSCWQ